MIPPHCWSVLPAVPEASAELDAGLGLGVGVGLGVAATVTARAVARAGVPAALGITSDRAVASPQMAPTSRASRMAVDRSQ
ncbi:MAG: hypothetical protein WA751_07465 [Candidatus Dormiibacterota bacterium]